MPSRSCRMSVLVVLGGLTLVVPFELGVLVRLFRHQARQAALGELALEALPDRGLLVRVLDLLARRERLVDARVLRVDGTRGVEGEVARGLAAKVEMLVVPLVRRDE